MWQQARVMHREAGLDFDQYYGYYMVSGYVYSSPDALVWAHVEEETDAWFIHLAIGDMKQFFQAMPRWHANVTFARLAKRGDSLRTYKTEDLCRRLNIDPEPLKLR